MNPWMIKGVVILIGMVLKALGEIVNHNFQRFFLPIIYGTGVGLLSTHLDKAGLIHHDYWVGLIVLPMIVALVMGYKEYGNKDSVARALWLFVITVVSGLGPTLTGHESWFAYIPICILAGFVGTLVRNINNLIGAPLNGLMIVAHILFIH